jgi:hypothetical protein
MAWVNGFLGVHDGVSIRWLQLVAGLSGSSERSGEEKTKAAAELLRE